MRLSCSMFVFLPPRNSRSLLFIIPESGFGVGKWHSLQNAKCTVRTICIKELIARSGRLAQKLAQKLEQLSRCQKTCHRCGIKLCIPRQKFIPSSNIWSLPTKSLELYLLVNLLFDPQHHCNDNLRPSIIGVCA